MQAHMLKHQAPARRGDRLAAAAAAPRRTSRGVVAAQAPAQRQGDGAAERASRRAALAALAASLALSRGLPAQAAAREEAREGAAVRHTDAEWRELLTPDQYAVLRQAATEFPTSSPLNKEYRKGTFLCAGCAAPLFSSAAKFDSGTGWPSFFEPLPGAVAETKDASLGRFIGLRTEVRVLWVGLWGSQQKLGACF